MRLLLLGFSALLILPSSFAQSAESIFREVDRRQRQVQSQRAEIDMEIVDDRGRVRSSSMILLTKIGDGDTFKALVVFTAPEDIRGTGLLTLSDDTNVFPGHGDDGSIGSSKAEYATYASKEHPADQSGDVLWLSS